MLRTLLLAALPLVLLAACAGPAPEVAAPAAPVVASAPALLPASGVIVARRPVAATSPRVLAAIGRKDAARAGAPAAEFPATEFIVRTEGGRTFSVVQPDEPGLRPGRHVRLAGAQQARLSLDE